MHMRYTMEKSLKTDQLSVEALDQRKAYRKAYREKNRDKINAYHREWSKKNRDKIRLINMRYWEKKAMEINGEEITE